MKNDPQMIERLLPTSEDEDAKAEFVDAVTMFTDSLDFDVNTPLRWRAGHDMNIARPGASVVIDPAVRAGVPTILGTEVTTLDAMERTMAFPYEETKNATRLGITVTQLQVASLCAGPRRLQPTGKLQFTGGLRKLYIGTDPALLHDSTASVNTRKIPPAS